MFSSPSWGRKGKRVSFEFVASVRLGAASISKAERSNGDSKAFLFKCTGVISVLLHVSNISHLLFIWQVTMINVAFLLCTGITINVYAQKLTNLKFASPSAQVLPTTKFLSSLIFSSLFRVQSKHIIRGCPVTTRQRLLMILIGGFDAAAYVAFCTGFSLCGASLSNILLSSMGQIFTALSTQFILRKKLSHGQLAAITLVGLGIILRSAPPSLSLLSFYRELSNLPERTVGVCFIILAAALYSCLGITYEALMSSNSPPPYQDILFTTSVIGSLGALCYQFLWVVPRWDIMFAANLSETDLTALQLLGYLVMFGVLFNLHMYVQSRVFKSDGAIGVGLINAVRGAILAVVTSLLFCSEDREPTLCLTYRSGLSALITTLGGVAWVLTGHQRQKSKGSKEFKKIQ